MTELQLTLDEKKLVEFAKKSYPKFLRNRRAKGLNDNYYACLISDSGNIYEGTPFCPKMATGTICCERQAIADMCFHETEKARIKSVLTIGPVCKGGVLSPCGLCREVINEFSDGKATFLSAWGHWDNKFTDFESIFKKLKKWTIGELLPHPWKDGPWDSV
jgi:cytidine deaminase